MVNQADSPPRPREEQHDMEDTVETDPLLPKENTSDGSVKWWRGVRCYSLYVLFLLLLAYLFNQLDRYMLAITIRPISQDLEFGDKGCLHNDSVQAFGENLKCNGTSEESCSRTVNLNGTEFCTWDYNGQGWDFQLLAGPIFILIYTFTGIFIGVAADVYNRKLLLSACLVLWSAATLVTGFVHEFWQLAVLRFALGLGEAGCTPFATSLIADYFTQSGRGTAMSVYNFGIYLGYSLSYALGNFITLANINGQGWRWAFILPGIPGIVLGILIAATVKEPQRTQRDIKPKRENNGDEARVVSKLFRVNTMLKNFTRPSLLLLCVAGSIRNAAGYVWAYNTQSYFEADGVDKETVGTYMSWIPLVGGCLGVLVGGLISDRVIQRYGLYARIVVLVVSQFLAAPFAAGALFLDTPWAFISLIPANVIGEMWVGVTLAVAVELVPGEIRTSAIAVYLFIISNIGGNVPLLVPPIQHTFQRDAMTEAEAIRGALYILYPGLYVLSGLLFLLTMCVVKRDQRRALQETVYRP